MSRLGEIILGTFLFHIFLPDLWDLLELLAESTYLNSLYFIRTQFVVPDSELIN